MYTTLVSLAVLAAAAVQGVVATDLSLSTPVFKQCAPAQLNWGASKGPYNLIVVPAADPCSTVLADLGDHTGTSMKWNVTLAAGTKVLVSLEDADSEEGWSSEITVQPSDDTSCLSPAQLAAVSSAAASASASSTPIPVSSATEAATVVNVGAGAATTSAAATAVGAAGAGVLGNSNGAAGLVFSGPLVLGGALLAALAVF